MWENWNPVRIIAGIGIRKQIPSLVYGSNILLVTTSGMIVRGQTKEIQNLCPNCSWIVKSVSPIPDLDEVDDIAIELSSYRATTIVALGGGSVIDTAKALSISLPQMLKQKKTPLNEWGRKNKEIHNITPIYLICLPTTSGTGSEVTPFATIWDNKFKVKRSLTGSFIYPKIALLDPELTLSLPWEITLYSGLDCISHSLESMWNKNATPVSIALAEKSLQLVINSLIKLKDSPNSLDDRKNMQEASMLAGMAISQTRTALAHSISYPLTLIYKIPHGLAASFSLLSILNYIEKNNLFKIKTDKLLLDSVKKTLIDINIKKYIYKFCTLNEILNTVDKMITSERSKNFIIDIDINKIKYIIEASFI